LSTIIYQTGCGCWVSWRQPSLQERRSHWVGSSREELSNFPKEARRKAGFQLRAVQRGQKPTDFKPMPTIGKGVEEIRIWTGETQPRISNLMNGEISRFSVDKLINLLGKVGMEVKVEVVSKVA
jgi:hypothetical protein